MSRYSDEQIAWAMSKVEQFTFPDPPWRWARTPEHVERMIVAYAEAFLDIVPMSDEPVERVRFNSRKQVPVDELISTVNGSLAKFPTPAEIRAIWVKREPTADGKGLMS
jgi:hypothetical protein